MIETLRTVRLYGSLGAKFGRVHRMAVSSAAEAVRALCSQLPGFESELMTSKDRGVGYVVYLGKTNLGEKTLHAPAGKEDIRIAPVLLGAKSGGLGQIFLGVAIVAFAWWAAPATVGAAGAAGAAGGTAAGAGFLGLTGGYALAAQIGVTMALGGAARLLSEQPTGLATSDGPNNGASYNFNGPVNTTAEGNAVPIHFGGGIIGGQTVSVGIYAEDQA